MARAKRADIVRRLFNLSNNWTRSQWEAVNQKGYEFSFDEQLSQDDKDALEEQGMPTFTINRILPVVEMLNYYATANNPRWQAIGVDGSDSDVAAVFSDLADFIWANSRGDALYANAINDAITKSVGYMLVSVDPNQDNGMGEVVLQNPDPFDLYVDPKSRDILFKDAAYIMIRKVLPKGHLESLHPGYKAKINKAATYEGKVALSSRAMGGASQKLFMQNDTTSDDIGITALGEQENLVEYFEVYEKVKVSYYNLFYRIPPSAAELRQIKIQCDVATKELTQELQVKLLEQDQAMQSAVQSGEMLPERYQLEMGKAQEMAENQVQSYAKECMSQMQAEASKVENKIVTEKELKILEKDPAIAKNIVEKIQFYGSRIKQNCIASDQVLFEKVLPDTITEYPLIPFHFKWTGTPYPMSAVSPLIGKQQEINKSHQIMVHNASLGSSLRWMYEEGAIDADIWEKYSAAPGALLPVRPGTTAPTPVMPAPLSNAFFTIVQEGKHDMEYLAGIYSSMQGDTSSQHETFRGMLALDEYGTRRIKQWMKTSIEPALRQLGEVLLQYSQAVYTANKRFRIVQPNALQDSKQAEVNIPIYNDMGEAIGKSMDISAGQFDVRIVAGSTLPVNRWAYLEELKQLLNLGVVDDIAVLAETDIRNKDKIAERKSMYAQMKSQIEGLDEEVKDKEGTIETLERQLVQAGIKQKIMQADVEINKEKEQAKTAISKGRIETEGKAKLLQNVMANNTHAAANEVNRTAAMTEREMSNALKDLKKKTSEKEKELDSRE